MALNDLTRMRGQIKGSFTKCKSFIAAANVTTPYEALKLRCDRLDALWEQFVAIDSQIAAQPDQASEYSVQEDVYLDLKERFLTVLNQVEDHKRQSMAQINGSPGVDELNATLNRFAETQRSMIEHSRPSDTRLPKLDIPTFHGEYCKWPTFKDLFLNSVHNVQMILDSRKFQYLQMYLKGEAATVISGMVCSGESYERAWNKVCERYDKQKPIIISYIKSFFELKPVTEPTAGAIRALADNSDCILRGLKSLGEDAESRDPWIIYLLLKKLDEETNRKWAESAAGSVDHPKIAQFIEFLNKRWSALECVQSYKTGSSTMARARCYITTESNNMVPRCANCDGLHQVYKCSSFKVLDVAQKRDFVKQNNLCFNCLSAEHRVNNCTSKHRCHTCGQQHHSCLHIDVSNQNKSANTQRHLASYSIQNNDIINQTVALPIAVVKASNVNGAGATICKVLMDSGSMGTFISEDLVQRLRLPRRNGRIRVGGIGGENSVATRGIVSLRLTSRFDSNSSVKVDALILKHISQEQKSKPANLSQLGFPPNLNMADDGSLSSRPIDILIGSQHFFNLLTKGKHTNKTGFPTIHNTIFGYVLAGKIHNGGEGSDGFHATLSHYDFKIDESLRRFWESEKEPQEQLKHYTEEEQFCEKHFQATHKHNGTGRHMVRLPFRDTSHGLGNSLTSAHKQFATLERRLARDESIRSQYNDFINEYIALGHMEKVPLSEVNKECAATFYLPHHPVLKPENRSTKCRVVFNGSAKSTTGVSLNDMLAVGPTIQRDLTSLLINFRRYRIGLCGDIVKMYRQVLVHPDDRDFQRILWRDTPNSPISHYRLCTVTYGTASAPFLALRCLRATGEEANCTHIASLIKNNFYVDDLIAGADSTENAVALKNEITVTLERRGFPLTKWVSNDPKVLENSNSQSDLDISGINAEGSLKILGLHWQPSTDCFTFKVTTVNKACTKRVILSESSKIYDPLGFLSPCTVLIKIMYQQLWLQHFNWDEELPSSHSRKWLTFRQHYKCFNELRIPRWIHYNSATKLQLCGFSDASERAYAAVVYCRVASDDTSQVFLLTAKTRVAPLKQVSLPRLELAGALLLAKLFKAVMAALALKEVECIAWTDSMIVLGWLSSHPRRWKTYVANRVAEINDTLPRPSWRHVTSSDNPADAATRGLEPEALLTCSLWWHGPTWLRHAQDTWPQLPAKTVDTNNRILAEERRNTCFAFPVMQQPDVISELLHRFSNLHKVLYLIAAWNRIVKKWRDSNLSSASEYTAAEIHAALLHCIRWAQAQHFPKEIQHLSKNQPLSIKSSIIKLSPFLDSSSILRVGGRIKYATCNLNTKHPILISKDSILAKRIVSAQHLKHLHAGPTLLMNILRQQFWITHCRRLIKQEINKCIVCARFRAATCSQQMADLPPSRVTQARPFLRTGVDYAGPFLIKVPMARKVPLLKGYIAVFVCLATRAIHLEIVSDLTSDAFIAALKRFVSRRGLPSDIHSDNGTNFIGASRELMKNFKQLSKTKGVGSYMAQANINWHLIPPGAPHFGGIWESAVKATKFHLRRVIGDAKLTYEEFSTLLCEIEAQLNSRPLTTLYDDDIDNIDVLTPGHFLVGQQLVQVPEPSLNHIKLNRLSRWQLITRLRQDFWRRWQREYITTLQQRTKWLETKQNLSPGSVVLVYDDRAPPSCWQMGRVTEVHPGKDNLVRVATVKTSSSTMKRPLTKLCKLPTDD